jgi:hypothetical protein
MLDAACQSPGCGSLGDGSPSVTDVAWASPSPQGRAPSTPR